MFRRKDSDVVRPHTAEGSGNEGGYPRPVGESKHQPELPRRAVDLPTVPAQTPAQERPTEGVTSATAEKKQLIVGHGISLSGEITACDRLVVLGSVQVTLNQTRAIEIAETGRFTNGKAEVEEAEISGLYEGELTVRRRLLIRSTGQVKGNVRYGQLEIERGGMLTGTVAMLGETQAHPSGSRDPAPLAAQAAAA